MHRTLEELQEEAGAFSWCKRGKGQGSLFKSLIYLDQRVVTEAHASSTPTCVRFQGAAVNMVEPHTTGLMLWLFVSGNFWELSCGSELFVLYLKHPSQMCIWALLESRAYASGLLYFQSFSNEKKKEWEKERDRDKKRGIKEGKKENQTTQNRPPLHASWMLKLFFKWSMDTTDWNL